MPSVDALNLDAALFPVYPSGNLEKVTNSRYSCMHLENVP